MKHKLPKDFLTNSRPKSYEDIQQSIAEQTGFELMDTNITPILIIVIAVIFIFIVYMVKG